MIRYSELKTLQNLYREHITFTAYQQEQLKKVNSRVLSYVNTPRQMLNLYLLKTLVNINRNTQQETVITLPDWISNEDFLTFTARIKNEL